MGRCREVKRSAVLFLLFNRPSTTGQVFRAIREARPPRLYLAADGPRPEVAGEAELVEEVREIATAVDWDCDVFTLFRKKNLGCKEAVASAIDWFFEHETQGIILEDDCLPDLSFFRFCDELLNAHAGNDHVAAITGNNFQQGRIRGDSSYYYSKFNHVWGWATWRRAWEQYDRSLDFWPEWSKSSAWVTHTPDRRERKYWEGIFEQARAGQIDTWDYAWTASVWRNGGLTATPNVNLVKNIGFGPSATHTTQPTSSLASIPTMPLSEIVHPAEISQDVEADEHAFAHVFKPRTFSPKHWLWRRFSKIAKVL